MAASSKAVLVGGEPSGRRYGDGYHEGVWSRKTVTALWDGHIIKLRTECDAGGKTRCAIIRIGDEFSVARIIGHVQ